MKLDKNIIEVMCKLHAKFQLATITATLVFSTRKWAMSKRFSATRPLFSALALLPENLSDLDQNLHNYTTDQ